MSFGKPQKTVLFLAALFTAIGLLMLKPWSRVKNSPDTIPTPDPEKHPIYSKYKFAKDENIIYFGTQPLFIPSGIITEAMNKDLILREELEKEGLKIEQVPFLKGADLNHYVKKGNLSVGVCGDMPTLTIAVESDVIITSLIQQGYSSLVANRPMLMNDLKGKRIAYPYGSLAHFAVLHILRDYNLSPKNIHLINMDINLMPQALENGDIDAFSAWEPIPSITLQKDKDFTVISRTTCSGFLFFTKDFAAKHPKALRLIMASELRAIQWLSFNRKNLLLCSQMTRTEGIRLFGNNLDATARDYARIADSDIKSMTDLPIIPDSYFEKDSILKEEFNFLKEVNKLPKDASWGKVKESIDNKIIYEITQNSLKYRLNEFNYDLGNAENEQ